MHRETLSVTAVWLLVHFAGLPAQNPPPLEPGARVSISAPDHGVRRLVGTFSGYDSGSIGIKPDNEQSSVWVPLNSVTRLQQSRGRKSNTRKGALIGSLVGGAFGAAAAAATYKECVSESWMDCFMQPESAGQAAAWGGLITGLLGAGVGALIGASEKTDRWEEVPVDRLRVSFAPQPDGRFAFGLSVAF